MSESNVESFERLAFRKKLTVYAAAQQVDDGDFADAIYTAVTGFGIDETQFRDMFGLTKGAVERWMTQKNLPQPLIRPKICGWILGRI